MSTNHILAFLNKYSMQVLLAWLAVYLPVKKWGGRTFTKRFLALSAAGYAVAVLYMTLFSREPHLQMQYQLEPLWSYRQAFRFEAGRLRIQNAEFAWYIESNILLFIPFGILFSEFLDAFRKTTLLRVVSAGCLASALLEISQLVFRIGLFELDDILNNSIGALLGFCFYALTQKLMRIDRLRKES